MHMQQSRSLFIFFLALLTATTPFAIDTYLPAMPTMAQDFDVPLSSIELSISLFLIGFALGQLIGGPVSDRFGRRMSATIGLTLFALASFAAAFATSVESFLLFRFLQAFGGGFATVVSNATVRDHFTGKESAQILSMIQSIMYIAPLLAPVIGSLLLHFASWNAIFIFLGFYFANLSHHSNALPKHALCSYWKFFCCRTLYIFNGIIFYLS